MLPVDVSPELEKPMLVVEVHEPGQVPRAVRRSALDGDAPTGRSSCVLVAG